MDLIKQSNVKSGITINWFDQPNRYTGFRKVQCVKLENLIRVLVSRCKP